MAKNSVFENMNLTDNSYLLDEDLLKNEVESGKSEEKTVRLKDLVEFPDHPFRVETENADFEELVDSIKNNGLIYPLLVRPVGKKYQIVAGHRRMAACREAGVEEIPVIIRSMDDYDATVLMVHSNLYRTEISIAEKAKAYRMCHDAEKHQGKNIGGDTAAKLGAEASDSRRKVYRYIRLSYLTDSLLNMVDTKQLTINAGIELSYLDGKSQNSIVQALENYSLSLSVEQAAALRKIFEENGESLTDEKIIALLLGEEKKKSVKNNISFKKKELQDYFEPETDVERMSEIIVKLLEKYKEGLLNQFLD